MESLLVINVQRVNIASWIVNPVKECTLKLKLGETKQTTQSKNKEQKQMNEK